MKRLDLYRSMLFAYIEKSLQEDGHHKSYEGRITTSTTYPNYFNQNDLSKTELTLDCYVFGPHRHYSWVGATLDDCLDQAEADLKEWAKDWNENLRLRDLET